jgi:hypothetical protein
MEFVVVVYPTHRQVRIDGQRAGFTNATLRVDTGHHIVDLGSPSDYRPAFVGKRIQSTTILDPLIINDFNQAAASVL